MCANIDGKYEGAFINGQSTGPQITPTISRVMGFGVTPMGGLVVDFSIVTDNVDKTED